MEKIATDLLLPELFFDVCLNKVKNSFVNIQESHITNVYNKVVMDHLKTAPYHFFTLKKYNDKSYVLYPKFKESLQFEAFILNDLKGLKNANLKEGVGYIFPNFSLTDIQSFLLKIEKYNLQSLIYDARNFMKVDMKEVLRILVSDFVDYFNKPISQVLIKNSLDKIPNYYDKRQLYKCSSLNELLFMIADLFYKKDKDSCVEIYTIPKGHWTISFLICKDNVTNSERYKYAKNYSPFHNPYYIKLSPDHKIALLEHSRYTGD